MEQSLINSYVFPKRYLNHGIFTDKFGNVLFR